eukprot:m.193302 g.193302  ORF g.193302 m.193302 type:complete len:184 (-) comp18630_c0_seq2:1297-1848(-)
MPDEYNNASQKAGGGRTVEIAHKAVNTTAPQDESLQTSAALLKQGIQSAAVSLTDLSDSIRLSGNGRKCVLLVRHGESEGNVDPGVYEEKPDHVIRLTESGLRMSSRAGKVLREYLQEHEIHHARMMVSPFFRTRETAAKILQECGDFITHGVSESPLLVEQVCRQTAYTTLFLERTPGLGTL